MHNILHLHVAQQLPFIKVHAAASYISPTNGNDAELNRHFRLGAFLKLI